MLNDVSIAEHLRHSYEFYHCLLLGLSAKEINYENRLRDRNIESNLAYAIARMLELKAQLELPLEDIRMKLHLKEAQTSLVDTSFERELVY